MIIKDNNNDRTDIDTFLTTAGEDGIKVWVSFCQIRDEAGLVR